MQLGSNYEYLATLKTNFLDENYMNAVHAIFHELPRYRVFVDVSPRVGLIE